MRRRGRRRVHGGASSAHALGSRVIGTGRAADREAALGLGTDVFVDLQAGPLEEAGEVDVVFDVIGGEVLERSAPLVRAWAERWSRSSACRRCGRPTAGRSSLSSSRTGSGWRTSPSGCGPGGRSRSSGPYGLVGRGAVRVHARPPDARQDDHPRHGRRITEGGYQGSQLLRAPHRPWPSPVERETGLDHGPGIMLSRTVDISEVPEN